MHCFWTPLHHWYMVALWVQKSTFQIRDEDTSTKNICTAGLSLKKIMHSFPLQGHYSSFTPKHQCEINPCETPLYTHIHLFIQCAGKRYRFSSSEFFLSWFNTFPPRDPNYIWQPDPTVKMDHLYGPVSMRQPWYSDQWLSQESSIQLCYSNLIIWLYKKYLDGATAVKQGGVCFMSISTIQDPCSLHHISKFKTVSSHLL